MYNLENLGESNGRLYGAELAKAIREDLKKRGVKGCTVRKAHCSSIYVTVKATADDIASIEEMKLRHNYSHFACDADSASGVYTGEKWLYADEYSKMTEEERQTAYNNYIVYRLKRFRGVNTHYMEREHVPEATTKFFEKLKAVYLISNQWNYDNSDYMTDYFDVGYYLDIDIKLPEDFEPRQTMTDEEKADYEREIAQKEEERRLAIEKYERERKEAEEAQKRRQEADKKAYDLIYSDAEIIDLSEALYITNLQGGIGKECSISELMESIETYEHSPQDAQITRKVVFHSPTAYNEFCERFLYDFTFLSGKGGTATDDVRVNDENYRNLTPEQWESIKFYLSDSVAVYLNDDLKLIIDPEGYDYARYVYLPTENSEIRPYKAESERQKEESETKQPFHFPKPIKEQIENLYIGQEITVYKCDGWILNNIYGGAGTVTDISEGHYAQYNGVFITLQYGRKQNKVFLRDNNDCLVYDGIKDRLPDEVTGERVSERMTRMYNYNELFPRVLEYYGRKGEEPIIDTIQR